MHQRKLIRQKIKALLVDQTDAGSKVFAGRKRPFRESDLPAIVIYTEDESPEKWNESLEYKRSLQATIEVHVKGSQSESIDDVLDDYAEAIETILVPNYTLDDLVNSLEMGDQDIALANEDGAYIAGRLKMTFPIEYFTQYEPENVDAFEKTVTTYDSDEGPENSKPNDTVNLPQE